MNWIIPRRILAFSSPTENEEERLPPEAFIEKFKDLNITAVIRLNESLYDETTFTKNRIKVYNLEFVDGSCPDDVNTLILIIVNRN